MTSQAEKAKSQSPSPPAETTSTSAIEPVIDNDDVVEVDDNDSALGGSNSQSDYTSVASSIYKGVFEHGRRYRTLREGEYFNPVDDQQFESAANNHLSILLADQREKNQFFRSPINLESAQILDIGSGEGQWALDVADAYSGVTIHAVDLHPSPQDWVAPNCIFEIDDVTKPWTWTQKFDLIHLRWDLGCFTDDQWKDVYRKAYDQLKPGGWIEQLEYDLNFRTDDNSIPPGSCMSRWMPIFDRCAEKMGHRINIAGTIRRDIEEAGFTNVHEQTKKFPIGTWPRDPLWKEIGRVEMNAFKLGLEGYSMFLLTHFGEPKPWTPEEVQMLLLELRRDLDNRKIHVYRLGKRVWAQKPDNAE